MVTRANTSEDIASFDVVVRSVIGTVEVSQHFDAEPPHIVAFKMIADHDTPGVYEFPIVGTDIVNRVTVERIKQETD